MAHATFPKDQVAELTRCRKNDVENWLPGAGLGRQADNEREAGRPSSARRTSLLFLELQQQTVQAVAWRHTRANKARKVSMDIAMRCPLVFSEEAPRGEHAEEDLEKVKEEMTKAAVLETKAKVLTTIPASASLTSNDQRGARISVYVC